MEYSSLILKNGSFLRWIFPQEWHTRIWPDGSLMVCPDGADKCDASAMVFWLPCGIFFGMLIWDRVAGCIWKMLFFFGDFFRDCLRVCFFLANLCFSKPSRLIFQWIYQLFGLRFWFKKGEVTFGGWLTKKLFRSIFSRPGHIISRTSKSCPFSLRTNLLWNCSPKNNWRGRDEGRKCLQNPSFDEISKQYPNRVLVVALFKSFYSELAGSKKSLCKNHSVFQPWPLLPCWGLQGSELHSCLGMAWSSTLRLVSSAAKRCYQKCRYFFGGARNM